MTHVKNRAPKGCAIPSSAESHLCVALWLHKAAHDTKHTVQRMVFGESRKAWDDRMIRPLGRPGYVRVLWIQAEAKASILQAEAVS